MQPLILATILLLSITSFPAARSQGEVLNIVQIRNVTNNDTKFIVDKKNLELILSKITRDTEIGVLSIAGEFRKGKSFILNFFLQYLQYLNAHQKKSLMREDLVLDESKLYDSIRNKNHPWLRNIQKNSGFHFRAGIMRETSGINVWSEPLMVPGESGRRMAILLMDSQGLYDDQTNPDDNVKLFTLVSMLSSTLMMNTAGSINSEQFAKLQYFLEYASAGISIAPDVKLFQNLSFLIRDFQLQEDLKGWTGGHLMLTRFLDSDQSDIRRTGKALRRGFQGINCFPLPHPGKSVTRRDYDGSLGKIDIDFLADLQTYVVDTVDWLHPRKVLLETLTKDNFLLQVMSITDKMNKGLSPKELARLQESEIITRVTDMVSALVREHEDKLRKYVQSKGNYSGFTDTMIWEDITNEHHRMKDVMLIKVKENATLCLPIRLEESGKPVSGIESLREELHRRFEAVIYDLVASAIKARNDAKKIEDERILRRITDMVSALVREQEDKLRKYVHNRNYLRFTDTMIQEDITNEHRRMKDKMLIEAKHNATLCLSVPVKSGKPVSGVESLREALDQRFESVSYDLVASAIKARNHAAKVEADRKALEKALQETRDKAEALQREKEEAERIRRWKQCDKNGWDREPTKWCDKNGYCGSACSIPLLGEAGGCKTTQGNRWDGNFVRCTTAEDCSGCWKCAQPCIF